ENETVVWTRLLSKGEFQPTLASAFGAGRGWGAILPFLLIALTALVLAGAATPRLRLDARALAWALLTLAAWALFAALAPTALGIDHRGLLDIRAAGDPTALNLLLHDGVRYPLTKLTLYAGLAGLAMVLAMWALRRLHVHRGDVGDTDDRALGREQPHDGHPARASSSPS
ncbi:MAG: hypothetical protein ACYDC2_03285, partial [Solirubrobacteraceae bacterium]